MDRGEGEMIIYKMGHCCQVLMDKTGGEEVTVTTFSETEKDCRERKTSVNKLSSEILKEWRTRNEGNNDKTPHTGNQRDPRPSTSGRIEETASGNSYQKG